MAESSSKQWKAEENDGGGIDRMSTLPDSVLLHILSFLPTKTSVATMSLVSRRWRHLWEHLQVFDFSDEWKLFESFAFFVSYVLAIRRSRHIRKMRLCCDISDEDTFRADSVKAWIRAANGPRLEELHLTFYNGDDSSFVVLPHTLLNSTSLVSLSLNGTIHVTVNLQHSSAAVHLPSLKMLQLDIFSVDSLDALLSGCPILETLIILDAFESMSKFRVPPFLKRLEFSGTESRVYLEIDAPGLQYLRIFNSIFDAAVGNLHNVVEAYIDVLCESESLNPILNLLRALSRIKHLVLHCSPAKWLLCAPILDFPEFHHLLRLELILRSFNSSFLFNMLQKCPMLQALITQKDKEASPLGTREPQTRVPNCLVSRLTYIHMKEYQGCEDELAFAEYILRNGLVLKTMIIVADFSLDLGKKYCILKRLSDIPRGSVMCQLKFD